MSKLYVQHDYAIKGKDYVDTEGGDTPIGGGADYSPDTHKVGKWYDGSDIYECTYSTEWAVAAQTSGSQAQTLTLNVPDIKDLIWYEIIPISRSSANSAVQGNAPRDTVFSVTVNGDIVVDNQQVIFHTVTSHDNINWVGFSDVLVRIRFTKTE